MNSLFTLKNLILLVSTIALLFLESALAQSTFKLSGNVKSQVGDELIGANANLESTLSMKTPSEAYLVGTEGAIKVHSRFHESKCISLYKDGQETKFDFPFMGNGYVYEIEEVNTCLLKGCNESPKLPLSFSLSLSQILDRVCNSFKQE